MLSPTQETTLHALMDCIIPPDEDPGAWDAGAGNYLIRQFERDLRDSLDFYRAGLDALEAEAQAAGQTSFAALPPAQQTALLQRIETGAVAQAWPVDPIQFFQTAVRHTAEGYYSDPGNGGNRAGVAWKMIGFVPSSSEGARP